MVAALFFILRLALLAMVFLFGVTQVLVPLVKDEPLFPSFRKGGRGPNDPDKEPPTTGGQKEGEGR